MLPFTPEPSSLVSFDLDSSNLAEQYDALSDLQFEHGRQLAVALGIQKGHRILDVGAGTGRLAEHLAQLAGGPEWVAAVDPLAHRIDLARQRLGASARLEVGLAEDLSFFEDNTFDHVIFNAVFHWLPDQGSALREAACVLKPGGRVGITTVDRSSPNTFQAAIEHVLNTPPFTQVKPLEWLPYRVTAPQLQGLLEGAGLEAEQLDTRNFIDYFQNGEEIFAYSASSSFGNFLKEIPAEHVAAARQALLEELESQRGEHGIAYRRHTLFAIARKSLV